jgi:mono/diheme cytochrome c family protein
MTILLVGGLIWFVTFEQTAINTIPNQLSDTRPEITVSEDAGDPSQGAALWQTLECRQCHGDNAEGTERSMSVILAGTHISFEAFVDAVRRGPADMHPFSEAQITDQQLADLYAWLRSLEG